MARKFRLHAIGRETIADALTRHDGDVTAAAHELGVGMHSLRRKAKRLGLRCQTRGEARRRRREVRPIIDNGDGTFAVPLTRGQTAVVDACDASWVGTHNWHAMKRPAGGWYAARDAGDHRRVMMHREILPSADDTEVDHRDGDGLNNRRSNLRQATRPQNLFNRGVTRANSSGFKGVDFQKASGKWRARIAANGTKHMLGMFDTPEAAHEAYCEAALRLHGEFARTA